jgi:hypothetical protein
MVTTFGIVLGGFIGLGLFLYLGWKLIDALDNRRSRLRAQRRRDAGELSVCRWFVDENGDFGRVMTRLPKDGGGDGINKTDIPDFLKK